MKFHLFYLKETKELYAYTLNAKYAKLFLETRNPDAFYYKIEKLDKYRGMVFMNNNKTLQLEEVPLSDSNGNYTIIASIKEDSKLTFTCEDIDSECSYLKNHFNKNFPFNEEYSKLIDILTDTFVDENNHPILQIDTLALFYHLFRNTFIQIDEESLLKLNAEGNNSVLK